MGRAHRPHPRPSARTRRAACAPPKASGQRRMASNALPLPRTRKANKSTGGDGRASRPRRGPRAAHRHPHAHRTPLPARAPRPRRRVAARGGLANPPRTAGAHRAYLPGALGPPLTSSARARGGLASGVDGSGSAASACASRLYSRASDGPGGGPLPPCIFPAPFLWVRTPHRLASSSGSAERRATQRRRRTARPARDTHTRAVSVSQLPRVAAPAEYCLLHYTSKVLLLLCIVLTSAQPRAFEGSALGGTVGQV